MNNVAVRDSQSWVVLPHGVGELRCDLAVVVSLLAVGGVSTCLEKKGKVLRTQPRVSAGQCRLLVVPMRQTQTRTDEVRLERSRVVGGRRGDTRGAIIHRIDTQQW